jgi:hypothetical protein
MNTIKDFFSDITEPRDSNKRHKLLDIITISLCAVICGADSWEDIEEFGITKKVWFKSFLELPHGIPSHDTFTRVFASMNPKEFQEASSDGLTLFRSPQKTESSPSMERHSVGHTRRTPLLFIS